ncbi:hypothetical protein CIW49_13655 [Mycolicibacterium sp. P1-18]|nr:hypothetical protein CIW49_13655 [Mycolicibacterium sp. P1-18]
MPNEPTARTVTGRLDWSHDEDSNFSHHDGSIVAWFGDRSYYIWPERKDDVEIVGYRIMAGSSEGEHMPLGSVDIDGELGEPTLENAKATADAEATSLLNEEQLALVAIAKKWTDDVGDPRVRLDGIQIFYPVDKTAGVEIELIVSPDYEDWFDARRRHWFVGQDSPVNHPESLESLLRNLIAEHAPRLSISGQRE